MKKLTFWTLFVLTILSSCATQKRCYRKFPPQITTVTKDSIREVVVYRDTTIFIKLPGVTITKTDTLYIKNGLVLAREVTVSSNYATAKAWLAQNRINLTLTDKDTTLVLRLNNALKTARYWEVKYSTKTEVLPPKKFTPLFVKILAWIGVACLWVVILWVLRKFKVI